MKNKILISLLLLLIFASLIAQTAPINELAYLDKIRVACIGNSVTYGYGLVDREKDSYPARLQAMLGEKYDVRNFGFNGATLLKKGHKPFWEKPPYKQAIDFQPHIVVIHLGLNDTDPRNWANFKNEFIPDYKEMIKVFKNLEIDPAPSVWICRMTPIFSWHKRFTSGTRDDFWAIQNTIEKLAYQEKINLIDLHTPLNSRPDLFEDAVHPSAEGADIMASTVRSHITGDFGGLSLPPIFSDHMVIQRDEPVLFYGKADAGKKVRVRFAGKDIFVNAGYDGHWIAKFNAMQAGGPFKLTVSADKEIDIEDILVGEVWLCSGQSNMAFQLKREKYNEEEIPISNHPDIRLFNFHAVAWPGGGQFTGEEMQKINKGEYFELGPWKQCTPESAEEFSAIAYYFGKELHKKLGVPIGLIHNAVGGSNTESWIDRKTLEFNAEFVDMLENWLQNEQVQEWCRTRAADNLKNAVGPNQLHPFAPAYLFDTGMRPLEKYPFRGVIWYQGESNAEKISQHEELFTTMVSGWRGYVNKPELPFFYVQLSSLNRDTWPAFRDSQRSLMSMIPNVGMVVTSDIGNPKDVHPTNKKDVGQRLSLWALARVYGHDLEYSGPLYRSMAINKKKITIYFDHTGSGLSTSEDQIVRGFEIAGANGNYIPAKVKIKNNFIIVSGRKLSDPKNVRYGWKPYTDANLINNEGLPASTFTTEENLKKL